MNITNFILSRTSMLKQQPEEVKDPPGYEMFNTGGVEVEVAEYLYSLTRLYKPEYVVETGTHLGVSAAYIAQGLHDNNKGKLFTYEVIPSLLKQAQALWDDLKLRYRIVDHLVPSLKAVITSPIDLLFLDSEPQYRFDEFVYFWPMLKPGGIVIIHDLHPTLGKSGMTHDGMKDWPYGSWEDKLGRFVKEFKIQTLFAPSPRGLTIMQKTRSTDENIKLLRKVYEV